MNAISCTTGTKFVEKDRYWLHLLSDLTNLLAVYVDVADNVLQNSSSVLTEKICNGGYSVNEFINYSERAQQYRAVSKYPSQCTRLKYIYLPLNLLHVIAVH